MAQYIPEILLWLFVINHGIAFGAGLYEQRIVLPQWFIRSSESGVRVNSAAMRSTDVGRQFWAFVSTGPLTLLTIRGRRQLQVRVTRWLAYGLAAWWNTLPLAEHKACLAEPQERSFTCSSAIGPPACNLQRHSKPRGPPRAVVFGSALSTSFQT